jgi:tetratricopeptide (TPR) repeat protein
MPALAPMLEEARARLRAGDYLGAERLCRRLVELDRGAADAWSLLGEALLAQRRAAEAADALRQAVAARPDQADGHYQLGVALGRLGQPEAAAASYREAARLDPRHAAALTDLGVTLAQQGRLHEAVEALGRAAAARPEFAPAHHNLGVALAQQGRLEEGAAALREALRRRPDYPEAHYNLGNTLGELGRRDEALACYRRAVELRPDYADALNNLGLALTEAGKPGEAVVLLRQALRLRPELAAARNNLGLALADLGRFDEAAACYEAVLAKDPGNVDAHTNLGSAYKEAGRLEEAVACYDQALRLKPDGASAHWNRALAWLQAGDYARGWAGYEWRWKRKGARPRALPVPAWDGSPLEGRSILLWCEQGLGDAIQFARYAPLVQARGGRVVLECPPPLRRLFASLPGVDQLSTEGEPPPPCDCHAPLMSLPHLFQTTLATVPADVPYLAADPGRVAHWRSRLPLGLRVGVAWAGNPHHKWDRWRSFPPGALAPLAAVPGVVLVVLQKGPGLEALRADPVPFPPKHLDGFGPDAPFEETAAVIAALDLVVSADTAPAHLAGALAAPVWVPLAAISDWRWLRGRPDSPWFPTLRLFRQRTLGDWGDVFERMAAELARLAARRLAEGGGP